MLIKSSILLSITLFSTISAFGNEQSVHVKGRIMCGRDPASNIRYKLYDVDPLSDDLLNEGTSNGDGEIEVSGTHQEIGTIDPKLNIYHRCNYKGFLSSLCWQKVTIRVPQSYVSQGKRAERVFDFGTMNLEANIGSQSTDCFNK